MAAHKAWYSVEWFHYNRRQAPTPKGQLMSKTRLNLATINALTICQSLDSAAEALTMSEGAKWPAWLQYFLQALEYKAGRSQEYEACLERLQSDIAARLEQGRW